MNENTCEIKIYQAYPHSIVSIRSHLPGQNLIRLCRRATARFPLDSIRGEGSSEHILSLWVLYAKAQTEFGTREEAKRTYWRIDAALNNNTSSSRVANGTAQFYVAMADFERADSSKGDRAAVRNAIKALKTGLERGARPAGMLQDRIKELDSEVSGGVASSSPLSASSSSVLGRTDSLTGQISNVARAAGSAGNGNLGEMPQDNATDEDDDTDDVVFFKKKGKKAAQPAKKMSAGAPVVSSAPDDDDDVTKLDVAQNAVITTQPSPDDNDATIALPASMIGQSSQQEKMVESKAADLNPSADQAKSRDGVSFAPGVESSARAKSSLGARKVATSSTSTSLHRTPGKLTARKDPALSSSRKPLLSRKKIGGGAMRVSAFEDHPAESSDEDDGPNLMLAANKRKGSSSSGDDSKPPPQKISKMDIGYLLNWDPTAHRRKEAEDGEKKKPTPPSSFVASKLPAMEKIEEEATGHTERSNRSHASNASSKSNHDQTFDNTRKNNQTGESHGSAASGNSQSSKHSHHATPSASNSGELLANNGGAGGAAAGHPSISPAQLALVAKSNADFLPLVSEDNILRVNNTPFAKLGVIGKGGSCKVYRALSKECSVVAIKKVKLAGMDKKSINSYANEIRLLKSLRGNPAIIQLYDSEVDLQRKAIFLVMELGEVDLNHVLQQQALLDGQQQGGGSSCRNMNFIRLTWQQMLSAVHSIHEERIIHGDLKPANFLFVRGTLKLIDFGIAKAIQSDDTTNIYRDSQIGTLNYMSPESILDTGTGTNGAKMKCGRPSDVWALGCILYQMCYGRTPFAELRVIQKLQAIVNPNHEISFPDTVDEAAVDAIKLCLRRKAEDRAPIVGKNGLLNEHWFLHSGKRRSGSSQK